MKLTISASALVLTQALVAGEAWASGQGAVPGGTAGLVHWLSEHALAAVGLSGIAILTLVVGGIAVFRTTKSDDPFDSAVDSTTSEPH